MMKWIGVILLAGVAACSSQPAAPTGAGLCWRMFETPDQPPRFEILDRNVSNLESCAAQLEGARMLEGRPTAGAYNGHFIFATEDQITSAATLDGARVRLFEDEDRREIQKGLRALIENRRSGAAPVGEGRGDATARP